MHSETNIGYCPHSTENQLPGLPAGALKVCVGALGQPITLSLPTVVKVELGCNNFYMDSMNTLLGNL